MIESDDQRENYTHMFSVARTVPKESLYITCGRAPLRFLIQRRRLLYLWHLIYRDKTEIIYKYYLAQKLQNNANDWLYQTYQSKKDLNINLDDEDIVLMSKQKYKTYIDHQIFVSVRKYLENMRITHSKCKGIPAFTGKPETYIFSKQLQQEEIKVLYKLKSRMINVYDNFRNANSSIWCKTCFLFPETQSHLISCEKIKEKLANVIDFSTISYDHLHGTVGQQENLAKIYSIVLKTREDLLTQLTPNGDQSTGD